MKRPKRQNVVNGNKIKLPDKWKDYCETCNRDKGKKCNCR